MNKFTRAPWYASPEALRTALVGGGIHQVDLIRYLTGQQIEAVTAFGNTLGDLKFPSDKTRVALFQLAGGTVAQATITYEATPGFTGDEFRLMGTQGSIVNARWKSRDAKDFMVIEEDADAIVAGTHRCVKSFFGFSR